MTKATRRRPTWRWIALAATLSAVLPARPAHALTLDDRGEMRLGLRAYNSVRVGTEKMNGEDDPLTFPGSGTGHVRQHRHFLELKLDHDVRRLGMETKGLAWLLGWMNPNKLSYSLQYRGEGEGIYDYGSSEFSDQAEKLRQVRVNLPITAGTPLEPLVLIKTNRLPEELIRQRISRLR